MKQSSEFPVTLGASLALPRDVATQTVAILGIRGSGKTNTAGVFAEELLALHEQLLVIDPTDVWWGLKSSRDGKARGFPVVVFGGRHADLPLDASDGAVIADLIVDHNVSAICALRGFESKAQEHRFVTDLLRRLYYRKGQVDGPTPLSVVIDEASRLVPQRVMGEDAACVGAVQQLVRQGRSSGFGVVLIDQRAATVNKDVLAQLEMLIVHRTTSPQDRKALRDWIEAHDTENREAIFMQTLASLKVGEAWVWSPGWLDVFERVQVRERKTFDSSATPKLGQQRAQPTVLAEIDLDALRAALARTIDERDANDPAQLRARVAELEHEIASKQGVTDAQRLGYASGWADCRRLAFDYRDALTAKLGSAVVQLAGWAEQIKRELDAHNQQLDRELSATASSVVPHAVIVRQSARAQQTKRERIERAAVGDARSNGKQRNASVQTAVLDAIAFLDRSGATEITRAQLAAFCRYHPRTPTFVDALNALIEKHWIDVDAIEGYRLASKAKWDAVVELPRTSDDVQLAWRMRVDSIGNRILTALEQRSLTRLKLAQALDYHPRTPTFTNALRYLETVGLIARTDRAELTLTALFLGHNLTRAAR